MNMVASGVDKQLLFMSNNSWVQIDITSKDNLTQINTMPITTMEVNLAGAPFITDAYATINKRWDMAMQQLRKLEFSPATVEAKTKAILVKVYAAALYGVEAAGTPAAKVAQFTAAVMGVFRSANDNHNADLVLRGLSRRQ